MITQLELELLAQFGYDTHQLTNIVADTKNAQVTPISTDTKEAIDTNTSTATSTQPTSTQPTATQVIDMKPLFARIDALNDGMVERIKQYTTGQLLELATKFSCKQAISKSFREALGDDFDHYKTLREAVEKNKDLYHDVVLDCVLEKRGILINKNKEKNSEIVDAHQSSIDIFSKVATKMTKIDVPDNVQDFRNLLKENLCFIVYLKKTTCSFSCMSVTRNLTVLDKLYGKGKVEVSIFVEMLKKASPYYNERRRDRLENDDKIRAEAAKDAGRTSGYSTDGVFDYSNVASNMRTIYPSNIVELYITKPEDVVNYNEYNPTMPFEEMITQIKVANFETDSPLYQLCGDQIYFTADLIDPCYNYVISPQFDDNWEHLYEYMVANSTLFKKTAELLEHFHFSGSFKY